jgi:hypothetical protein
LCAIDAQKVEIPQISGVTKMKLVEDKNLRETPTRSRKKIQRNFLECFAIEGTKSYFF